MLRVAEKIARSDMGRQRTANEDSYYERSPLFAVADGMGGAQAGEVASRIAADSFDAVERADSPPEAYLRSIAEAANRRIHQLAEHDAARSGMGTTLTAALVEGDEVSFAHVGDSRAYVFRDGELKLLTSDHSLVEELRRQGRLTEEQAEEHPQRSIITRALGPEPEVEVDTMTWRGRPGDLYLLCSDGLTGMVKEPRIAEVLSTAHSLKAAVSELIREANEAGGRDNITVVAFRLEEAEQPAPIEQPTLVGPAAEEVELSAGAVRSATEAETTEEAPVPRRRAPSPARARRRRRAGTLIKVLAAGIVVAGIVVAAVYGVRQVHFLGADEGGRLALYRGLPYELPFGIELYSEIHSAPVQVSSLPPQRRQSAIDHELRSRDDAISLLEDLQRAARASSSQARGDRRPRQR